MLWTLTACEVSTLSELHTRGGITYTATYSDSKNRNTPLSPAASEESAPPGGDSPSVRSHRIMVSLDLQIAPFACDTIPTIPVISDKSFTGRPADWRLPLHLRPVLLFSPPLSSLPFSSKPDTHT